MNKQKVAILTDSSCDIPAKLAEKNEIFTLPMRILIDGKEYRDGIDITPREIYRILPTSSPKTSLPHREDMLSVFDRIRFSGYERVLGIFISSALSGTLQAVRLAAAEYPDLEFSFFESNTSSLALGGVALELALCLQQGKTWVQLQALTPLFLKGAKAFFSIDTLEYLKRGGRIGLITSFAGSMLQIKPTISFSADGQLASVGKVRGRKNALEDIAKRIRRITPENRRYNMAIVHGGAPEDAATLKKLLRPQLRAAEHVWEGEIDSTLAVHVGPRLIGAGVLTLEDIPFSEPGSFDDL